MFSSLSYSPHFFGQDLWTSKISTGCNSLQILPNMLSFLFRAMVVGRLECNRQLGAQRLCPISVILLSQPVGVFPWVREIKGHEEELGQAHHLLSKYPFSGPGLHQRCHFLAMGHWNERRAFFPKKGAWMWFLSSSAKKQVAPLPSHFQGSLWNFNHSNAQDFRKLAKIKPRRYNYKVRRNSLCWVT